MKIGYQQTYPQYPQKEKNGNFTEMLQIKVYINNKNDIKMQQLCNII